MYCVFKGRAEAQLFSISLLNQLSSQVGSWMELCWAWCVKSTQYTC